MEAPPPRSPPPKRTGLTEDVVRELADEFDGVSLSNDPPQPDSSLVFPKESTQPAQPIAEMTPQLQPPSPGPNALASPIEEIEEWVLGYHAWLFQSISIDLFQKNLLYSG